MQVKIFADSYKEPIGLIQERVNRPQQGPLFRQGGLQNNMIEANFQV